MYKYKYIPGWRIGLRGFSSRRESRGVADVAVKNSIAGVSRTTTLRFWTAGIRSELGAQCLTTPQVYLQIAFHAIQAASLRSNKRVPAHIAFQHYVEILALELVSWLILVWVGTFTRLETFFLPFLCGRGYSVCCCFLHTFAVFYAFLRRAKFISSPLLHSQLQVHPLPQCHNTPRIMEAWVAGRSSSPVRVVCWDYMRTSAPPACPNRSSFQERTRWWRL
mgnify:CR=1 FL=1